MCRTLGIWVSWVNISRETRIRAVQSHLLCLCPQSATMAFAMLSRKALNVVCKATPKKGTSKTVSSSCVSAMGGICNTIDRCTLDAIRMGIRILVGFQDSSGRHACVPVDTLAHQRHDT